MNFIFLKNISSIQKSTLLILFVTGLIKIPLVVRDIIMAEYFGVDRNMDIYLYALVVPTFLAAIVAASFNYFLIPSYLNIKTIKGTTSARQYIEQFFFLFILLAAVLIAITGLLIPHFLIHFNPKLFFDNETVHSFYIFSFLISIFIGLQLMSLLFTFLLQAEHHYVSSLFPQTFAPLACVVMLVLFGKEWGIISVIYGGLFGIILSLGVLFIRAYRLNLISRPQLHSELNKIENNYNQFWILNLAFIMPALVSVIDQQMAISLGEGNLTTLTYSMRLPDGITEILCAGLGTAVFSHFSEWASQNDHYKLQEAIQKIIVFSTVVIIPISIFILIFANPIIIVLFKRGAFTEVAVQNVSQVLQFYSFVIYLTVLATIGAKAISAIGKNNFFLKFALTICTLKILLNFIFIKSLGLKGLVLATIIMLIANCFLVFRFLKINGIHVFATSFLSRLSKCFLFSILFLIIIVCVRLTTANFLPVAQIAIALAISTVLLVIFIKTNPKLYLLTK